MMHLLSTSVLVSQYYFEGIANVITRRSASRLYSKSPEGLFSTYATTLTLGLTVIPRSDLQSPPTAARSQISMVRASSNATYCKADFT